jgi:hypothetical protein
MDQWKTDVIRFLTIYGFQMVLALTLVLVLDKFGNADCAVDRGHQRRFGAAGRVGQPHGGD